MKKQSSVRLLFEELLCEEKDDVKKGGEDTVLNDGGEKESSIMLNDVSERDRCRPRRGEGRMNFKRGEGGMRADSEATLKVENTRACSEASLKADNVRTCSESSLSVPNTDETRDPKPPQQVQPRRRRTARRAGGESGFRRSMQKTIKQDERVFFGSVSQVDLTGSLTSHGGSVPGLDNSGSNRSGVSGIY